MPITHAMWVHGHAVQAQNPERGIIGRFGFYATYTATNIYSNWLHFAIPTSVIVSDQRLNVIQIKIRYRTREAGKIKAIHVYDGEIKIASRDNLALQSTDWAVETVVIPNSPDVRWGLGVSILVAGDRIDPDENGFEQSVVDLVAVGADLR